MGLEPHVEGGYYRELWPSEVVLPEATPRYVGAPHILFLLYSSEGSEGHVIVSAELWPSHPGSPLTLTLILTSGGSEAVPCSGETVVLGPGIAGGKRPQQLVPPGVWQTARNGGPEAMLVSCIVSPALHPDEFRLKAP